jgi:hypothetical protein
MAVSWRSYIRPIVIRARLAWEWWQSGVTYYPLAPRVYRNPYPTYAKLRVQDPCIGTFEPFVGLLALSRHRRDST